MATVTLRGSLKARAGGGDHPVDGATVGEVLRALEAARPHLAGWILDERGRIRRHLHVFVNGDHGTEDAAVGPDDRVDVLQAISGG